MKKFAVYCSGNASRIIEFFKDNQEDEYPLEFLLYDGHNNEILNLLIELLPKTKIINFENTDNLKGKELSSKFNDDLHSNLEKHNIDYLFCFGTKILKSLLVDIYKNRIINFHPSLLPAFPGLNAIDQALNTSVQILGNTAHFIDSGIDTGPIIMQSVMLRKNYKIYSDILDMQLYMLSAIWTLLIEGRIYVDDSSNVIIIGCTVNKNILNSI